MGQTVKSVYYGRTSPPTAGIKGGFDLINQIADNLVNRHKFGVKYRFDNLDGLLFSKLLRTFKP